MQHGAKLCALKLVFYTHQPLLLRKRLTGTIPVFPNAVSELGKNTEVCLGDTPLTAALVMLQTLTLTTLHKIRRLIAPFLLSNCENTLKLQ
jgi:hypothetical protein